MASCKARSEGSAGPGWREQHTAGTVTDSLRDAPITYDAWERLLGWKETHYQNHPVDSTIVAYSYDRQRPPDQPLGRRRPLVLQGQPKGRADSYLPPTVDFPEPRATCYLAKGYS